MALRSFNDHGGRMWEVWEVVSSYEERKTMLVQPPALPERWLAFQSKGDRKRLFPVPDGWSEMSDAELAELLKRAAYSGKPRRLIE